MTQNEKGEKCKISCAEALAQKTLKDAILKDGPTRRMFYKKELLNLQAKEQEMEYPENIQKEMEVEKEYQDLLKSWAKIPSKIREKLATLLTEQLREYANNLCRNT